MFWGSRPVRRSLPPPPPLSLPLFRRWSDMTVACFPGCLPCCCLLIGYVYGTRCAAVPGIRHGCRFPRCRLFIAPFDGLSGVRPTRDRPAATCCPFDHGMPMADAAAAAAVDTLNYVVFLALPPPPRRHNKQMMMK